MPGTTVTSSVTIRAIASCSDTSTIATRSHSPDTEYTCETPSMPASFVAHSAMRCGSALMSTIAVIIGSGWWERVWRVVRGAQEAIPLYLCAALDCRRRRRAGDEIYNITGAANVMPRCGIEDRMLESEEAGERAETPAGRGQNLVYTLPHTTESIAEFLAPVLSRVDPAVPGTQVVVVTRSAETAIAVSETVLGLAGAGGIEVVPVTGAARAGRIFRSRPVLAVAGTPEELGALVRSSVLKLDTVRTVVIA